MNSFSVTGLLVALLFVLPNTLSAQSADRKNITLITTGNDTLRGTILLENKLKSCKSVTLKLHNETVSRPFRYDQIRSFSIQEEGQTLYFKTLIIQTDYSSEEFSNLSHHPQIDLVQDTVFAQLLLKGPRSVYFFVDQVVHKEHVLIETEEGRATDLINKSYRVNPIWIAYSQDYKNQLLNLLKTPDIPATRLLNAPFGKREILQLVKEYNVSVSSHASAYEYHEPKTQFKVGAVVGGNYTSLKFTGNTESYNQLELQPSYGVNAGLMTKIIFPATRKRWLLYNELLYLSYQLESMNVSYVYLESGNSYRAITKASVQASYIKLFSALRYLTQYKYLPYLQVGIVNGYAIQNETKSTYEAKYYAAPSTETQSLMNFRKYEQSLFAGIGCTYQQFGTELRYEMGNGFSRMKSIHSVMSYGYLLLSYTF